MIVTCEKCQTRYRLDDARVSQRAARVRCSRCKHAFKVPSAAEREQKLHAIASEAAQTEAPFERDSELDATRVREPEPEPEPGADAAPEPSRPRPATGPDHADPEPEDPHELFGASLGDDAPDPAPLRTDTGAGDTDESDDDWQFGDDVAPPAKTVPPQSATPGDGLDMGGAVDELLRPREEPTSLEDLGDPESWDFLGTEGERAEARGFPDLAGEEGGGAGGLGLGEESSEQMPDEGAGRGALELPSTPLEALDAEPEAGTGRSLPWLRGVLHGLGWIATLCLLGVVAYASLLAPTAARREPARLHADGLVADGLHGRFIESWFGATYYVVSGHLHPLAGDPSETEAPDTGTVRSPAALQVRLLDADGAPIDGARAWVGAALPEAVLRETPPEVLRAELARRAALLAHSRPLPETGLRFDAVFETLPPEAERFRLEAAPTPPLPLESRVTGAPAASEPREDAGAEAATSEEAPPAGLER